MGGPDRLGAVDPRVARRARAHGRTARSRRRRRVLRGPPVLDQLLRLRGVHRAGPRRNGVPRRVRRARRARLAHDRRPPSRRAAAVGRPRDRARALPARRLLVGRHRVHATRRRLVAAARPRWGSGAPRSRDRGGERADRGSAHVAAGRNGGARACDRRRRASARPVAARPRRTSSRHARRGGRARQRAARAVHRSRPARPRRPRGLHDRREPSARDAAPPRTAAARSHRVAGELLRPRPALERRHVRSRRSDAGADRRAAPRRRDPRQGGAVHEHEPPHRAERHDRAAVRQGSPRSLRRVRAVALRSLDNPRSRPRAPDRRDRGQEARRVPRRHRAGRHVDLLRVNLSGARARSCA